jgi:peptidoglycan hydrolase CwlO-like protein
MKREIEEKKNKLLEEANELENQENHLNNSLDNAIDLAAELNPTAAGVPTP